MKVKCPTCENMNEKEDALKLGNRYYCLSCGEEKQANIEKNKDGWDDLFDYICQKYEIKQPTGMMFKQIGEFRKEPYNYTNTGMYLTLKYFFDILDNEVLEDSGIGIIPYFYEQAKQHYIDRVNIEEYMDNFECSETTKIIKVNPFQEKYQLQKQLSFDNITFEGEIDVTEDN